MVLTRFIPDWWHVVLPAIHTMSHAVLRYIHSVACSDAMILCHAVLLHMYAIALT